jgi:hypothetical protein
MASPDSFPIHTIIVGHAGSQLESNTDAFLALGIPQAKMKERTRTDLAGAAAVQHHVAQRASGGRRAGEERPG